MTRLLRILNEYAENPSRTNYLDCKNKIVMMGFTKDQAYDVLDMMEESLVNWGNEDDS